MVPAGNEYAQTQHKFVHESESQSAVKTCVKSYFTKQYKIVDLPAFIFDRQQRCKRIEMFRCVGESLLALFALILSQQKVFTDHFF